ncbi:MAG TPA: hypothetical protein VJ858_02860, partial [Acidimicrobiia bacterium]|nr:hypothetical protein [Acidimicrobiia bacterium]
DEGALRPAESVVFFVDGTFAGSAPLDLERPDIQESYGTPDVLQSGFVGRMSDFIPVGVIEVRAFALANGVAEELPITEDAQADIAAG